MSAGTIFAALLFGPLFLAAGTVLALVVLATIAGWLGSRK